MDTVQWDTLLEGIGMVNQLEYPNLYLKILT